MSLMTNRLLASVAPTFAGLLLLLASAAEASCIRSSPAELRARADVIFDGVALQGATAPGVQRFRVTRYRKGSGPNVVRVRTGNVRRPDGTGSITSVSIVARRGEKWRIFAQRSAPKLLSTTTCDGSRRL
jgi:hypothetical protein